MYIIYGVELVEPYKSIGLMGQKARDLVHRYFDDKKDLGGHPYSDHLYFIYGKVVDEANYKCMDKYCGQAIYYNKMSIVALLHDLIEDTDLTLDDLRKEGIDDDTIIEAIDAITKRKDESYIDYVLRLEKNPIARQVKIYDLENNMDIKRLSKFGKSEMKRLNKYFWIYKYLNKEVEIEKVIENLKTE